MTDTTTARKPARAELTTDLVKSSRAALQEMRNTISPGPGFDGAADALAEALKRIEESKLWSK